MEYFQCGSYRLELGKKTYIMGILNVTPDSFSDGGRFLNSDKAISRIGEMLKEGADIIDIGAMSTRPNSKAISAEEEMQRLKPIFSVLKDTRNILWSIDTINSRTAQYALQCGASIVNDVSGVFNIEFASLVKQYNAGYIVMHSGGVPSGAKIYYDKGVVIAVKTFFDDIVNRLTGLGIKKNNICLDAGFGFAKELSDNLELLNGLSELKHLDMALLAGLSRKRFVGNLMQESMPENRLEGTLAAGFRAIENNVDILRVHDVGAHVRFVRVADAICKA